MKLGRLGQATSIKNNEFVLGGRSNEALDLERFEFFVLGQGESERKRQQEEKADHFSGMANVT